MYRLIRNSFWSEQANDKPRAKLAWNVVALPESKGRIGLINLIGPSLALLTTLKLRAVLLDLNKLKEILVNHLHQCSHFVEGNFSSHIRWMFDPSFMHLASYVGIGKTNLL